MRKHMTALGILLVTAIPLALGGTLMAASKSSMSELTTEVVSINLDQQTVTLKGSDGKTITLPVQGEALASLKSQKVTTGDKVIATVQDNGQGKQEVVTKLTKA